MANNRIQIKRSATTATPSSLLPGELAFSNVTGGSGVLFIGDTSNTSVVAIGGVRNPGTLTANQALVANSTSAINQVIVGNLAFTGVTQNILANGSVGTAGFVLASGGTGSNLYWVSTGSFSVNTAAQYVWTNTHTFQNTVTFGANLVVDTTSLRWVGNTTTSPTVTFANSGAFTIGNSSTTQTTGQILVQNTAGLTTVNAGSIQTTTVFANVSGSTGTFTGLVNASALNVVNQTNTATLFVTTSANIASSNVFVNTAGIFVTNTTGVVNAAVHSVGTAFTANSTLVNAAAINVTGQVNTATFFAATSANVGTAFTVTSSQVTSAVNTSLSGTLTTNTTVINGTVYVNATGFSTTGNANAANHYAGANALFSATSLAWTGNTTTSPTITLANTGAFTIGNSTTTQTASLITVANSTGNVVIGSGIVSINATGSVNASSFRVGTNFIANTTQLTISGTTVSANGGVGSQGQALLSNGATGSPYWGGVGTITGVTAGSGLTGGGSTGSVTVDVGAGNGIAVAADTVAVKVGTNLLFDGNANVATASNVTFSNVVTTDLTVNGNTVLGDATTDIVRFVAQVNSAIIPSANQIYDLGSNLLRWANVFANTLTVTGTASLGGNVSIGGTLTVTGNLITTNVQSVVVSDPMIYLAGNNYTSDILDIGIAANYNDGVTNRHTGLFRDHDDGIWKLFTNLTQELSGNNDVDINDASYRTATLQAFLNSSGLVTNVGSVYITANSTVNVNISANVLSLSGRANNDLLFTNSTGGITGLALNTIGGYVLQTNGTAIVYDFLDGGTF